VNALVSKQLKRVGYWAAKPRSDCDTVAGVLRDLVEVFIPPTEPRVDDFIDPAWDAAERRKVIEYLQRGRRHNSFFGTSLCRLCARENGCLDLTDDVYVWPDGLTHYVRDHLVKPPQDFVTHVLRRTR